MAYHSRIVTIGSISIGGDLPVRVQSMTNTDTLDTRASVEQCIRIIEAGGEMVRLTTQGMREAENLKNIKKELRAAHFFTPLIADVHFNPDVAELAARIVEKVRINPGNYADKRASFTKTDLTDAEYNAELERTRERILPLIEICREYGTVIRIGVNHGSLSDRVMNRYGNTTAGMAMSAIEFLEIFRAEGFNDVVVSMKASDTRLMVESNLQLIKMMTDRGMKYPVHLGITEAGEGDDGRIISAAGIGTLLAAGIGDTIRVSLSEAPESEIPVAKEIVRFTGGQEGRAKDPINIPDFRERDIHYKPEVILHDGEHCLDESGNAVTMEMISFEPGMPPLPEELPAGNIILNPVFSEDSLEKLSIDAAALLGRYFITRQADGICIRNIGKIKGEKLKDLAFSILQATEARITRTRYVSCPTCGRTKFNLHDAVREVKKATSHFKGMKIAIMGCIVNGPGEMAGADYGYVGAGEGKVHIYRGTNVVMKNIPEDEAVKNMLDLIESDQASL
jgi:(E)-4-hydroxy-3-methylbut-2-enyl-diphosphate synthase